VLWPDEATQQQPCCSEKMHVILGDGVDEVDADVGVEHARSTGGGRLNPSAIGQTKKNTAAADRVYPARRHDGSGASRSGGARRTAGHKHAGSKVPTQIDEVEMGRSTRQQRHARSGCLHGSVGSRRVAGPGRHHGSTGQGEIHLPPCDEDQVLMATAGGEPRDEAATATWR